MLSSRAMLTVLCRLFVYTTKDTEVCCSDRCSGTWMIASFLLHNSSIFNSKLGAESFIMLRDIFKRYLENLGLRVKG